MRKIKTVMSVVCLLILAGFAVSHQAFAGNGKTGIRVAAIYDASKLVNTPTKVYVLKPDEYTRYLDNKLDLKNQPVSGETPLFFSSMAKGEYYVGIEIAINQKVLNPHGLMLNDVWPHKYYKDDMYNGYGRRVEPAYDQNGALIGFPLFFVKWYRVVVADKVENVVALFLKKTEYITQWDKYYPQGKNYLIRQDTASRNAIWKAAHKIGITTSSDQRLKIIDLLERGGKVYFARNGKPNVFFVDPDGRINFNSRLDFDEAQKDFGTKPVQ